MSAVTAVDKSVSTSPATKATGFCMHPSPGSHLYCHERGFACSCECHADIAAFDDGRRIGEPPPVVDADEWDSMEGDDTPS